MDSSLVISSCMLALVLLFSFACDGEYLAMRRKDVIHFLAWQAMVGLIAVALAEVAKILL